MLQCQSTSFVWTSTSQSVPSILLMLVQLVPTGECQRALRIGAHKTLVLCTLLIVSISLAFLCSLGALAGFRLCLMHYSLVTVLVMLRCEDILTAMRASSLDARWQFTIWKSCCSTQLVLNAALLKCQVVTGMLVKTNVH